MRQSTIPALSEVSTIEARVINVTPELAAEWLARNPHNRTLNASAVAQFATDMSEGRWTFTGQPVIFDTNGNLSDGQHRLTAQVKAGTTLDWVVIGGIAANAQNYIDIGRPRSVADQLQIAGRTSPHGVASAARLELVYAGNANPTKPQVRAFAEANYKDLAIASNAGKGVAQVIQGSTAGYAIAYFHIAKTSPDLVVDFFEHLRSGADLPATSPILIARNTIARMGSARKSNDAGRVRFVNYLHKTWNLWATGRRVKSFAAPTGAVDITAPTRKAAA